MLEIELEALDLNDLLFYLKLHDLNTLFNAVD